MMELDTDEIEVIFSTLAICYIAYLWLIEKESKKSRFRRFYSRKENLDRHIFGFYETAFNAIKLNEEEFFKYTRMTLPVYNILISLLSAKLSKRKSCYTISCEARLAITLSYLSQGVSHQFLGWSFKIGRSTARKIILETCTDIWNVLSPIYVSEPNTHDYELTSEDFKKKWDLPNCVGAIDGKHIAIQNPAHSGSQFYNYKSFFSLVLLAICDANYNFTMVDIGGYGSQSDGGILAESVFGKKLLAGKLNLPSEKALPFSTIKFPHFFVGDPAFPLKKNLMRPYPGKCLTLDRKICNYRISRARVVIENSFGILVARWRVLRTSLNCKPENAEKIVLACIGLHNFIKMNQLSTHQYCPNNFVDHENSSGNQVPGHWRDETNGSSVFHQTTTRMGTNNSAKTAFQLRDHLKNYVNNEGSIPRQNKIK